MKLPLILTGDGDVAFFGSPQELAVAVEGVDVEDGVYDAYDAEGRPVELRAEGVSRNGVWIEVGTVTAIVDSEISAESSLSRTLADWLSRVGPPGVGVEGLTLAEMVSRCGQILQWSFDP